MPYQLSWDRRGTFGEARRPATRWGRNLSGVETPQTTRRRSPSSAARLCMGGETGVQSEGCGCTPYDCTRACPADRLVVTGYFARGAYGTSSRVPRWDIPNIYSQIKGSPDR